MSPRMLHVRSIAPLVTATASGDRNKYITHSSCSFVLTCHRFSLSPLDHAGYFGPSHSQSMWLWSELASHLNCTLGTLVPATLKACDCGVNLPATWTARWVLWSQPLSKHVTVDWTCPPPELHAGYFGPSHSQSMWLWTELARHLNCTLGTLVPATLRACGCGLDLPATWTATPRFPPRPLRAARNCQPSTNAACSGLHSVVHKGYIRKHTPQIKFPDHAAPVFLVVIVSDGTNFKLQLFYYRRATAQGACRHGVKTL
jgi:hypothetical protein